MGCDIHLFVERRTAKGWESADEWVAEEDDVRAYKRVPYGKSFYHDRNYNLFGILADVRNGVGFAGVKMGDGFNPIATPRGLPDDVTAEVRAASDDYGDDGHSHSHFTVAELMAYDWTQTTTLQGVVTPLAYWEWSRWDRRRGRGPASYSGSRWGKDIEELSEVKMADLVGLHTREKMDNEAREALKKLDNFQTIVRWQQHYYEVAQSFLGTTLPRLWQLGKPDDVRIIFWFDN